MLTLQPRKEYDDLAVLAGAVGGCRVTTWPPSHWPLSYWPPSYWPPRFRDAEELDQKAKKDVEVVDVVVDVVL